MCIRGKYDLPDHTFQFLNFVFVFLNQFIGVIRDELLYLVRIFNDLDPLIFI
jgi:hypothetical protein